MKSRSSAETEFLLEEFLPYELSVAANRISRLFSKQYSDAFGLSIAQWRVLAVVGRHTSLSPGQVADATEMDKVKVSRAAAGLAAMGLVTQGPDPSDGRARVLRLTQKGRDIHAGIVPLARTLEAQLAEGLTADEWQSLRSALRALNRHTATMSAAGEDDEK
jgi:DNA-binding MarR family transcriptional regulator